MSGAELANAARVCLLVLMAIGTIGGVILIVATVDFLIRGRKR